MDREIWKDVVGYDGLYQVSNLGNIRNTKKNKLKKIFINEKGYCQTTLNKNGKLKQVRLHQLVAKAFIPNPNNYIEINHIDGNKLNNELSNLEWCSRKHNVIHAYKTGLISKHQIEKTTIKMKEKNKKPIVQIANGIVINEFESIQKASEMLKIHYSCILRVLKNKHKKTHGFVFRYK